MTKESNAGGTFLGREKFDQFRRAHPEVEALEAFVIDVNGSAIGKRLSIREAHRIFTGGVAFSACAPMLDCRGRGHDPAGLGRSDGDPDGILVPVPETLAPMRWAKPPLAQVMCTMRDSSTMASLWFDPRVVLQQVLDKCRAAGIHPVVACELEFYLISRRRTEGGGLRAAENLRSGEASRRAANLSLEAIEDHGHFLAQVSLAAEEQRIPLTATVAEYGVEQFEINLRHTADPMQAADHAVLLKRLVRGVARANGIDATFMAKPFSDQPGNGLHVHMSLADDVGANRFALPGGERLLSQAIAGMQTLMLDSIALFAPNFNSFRRLASSSSPLSNTWGYNNRSVAFRIPTGTLTDRRIEHRVAGADASPHLVIAAVLSGALHGIAKGLTPTDQTQGRASQPTDPGMPRNLHAALERLRCAERLHEYVSRRYLDAYAELKRGEFDALFESLSAREIEFYA